MEQHQLDLIRDLNDAGNRKRADGRGDSWANSHREHLPNFYMQDMDSFFGSFMLAKDVDDQLFLEYCPDSYKNRANIIRNFSIVAIFDRKSTREYALSSMNSLPTAFYLYITRILSNNQIIKPKFFFVTGNYSPYQLLEIDINNGELVQEYELGKDNWMNIWKAAGLIDMRSKLEVWMREKYP